MAFFRTIFGFIIAILLIGFAIANRQETALIYSPIHEPLNVPLYLISLIFLAIGFILGGLIVWMNNAPTRKVKRQQRKTIKALEKELSTAQNKTESADTPASEFFPALPQQNTKTKTALPASENSSIK